MSDQLAAAIGAVDSRINDLVDRVSRLEETFDEIRTLLHALIVEGDDGPQVKDGS